MGISKRTKKDGATVYVIDYRTPDGTRIREKGGFSRQAARRKLQKRLNEASEGTLDRNRKSATPFREFAQEFLEKHAATSERPDWF